MVCWKNVFQQVVRSAATICPRPQQVDLWPFNIEMVSESRVTCADVTCATAVPILVFSGLSVLDFDPIYATDRQTSDEHDCLMAHTPDARHNNVSSNVGTCGLLCASLILVGNNLFPHKTILYTRISYPWATKVVRKSVRCAEKNEFQPAVREAATICPTPCKFTFELLTLKELSESRMTWATSVPIFVFPGLSVLDFDPVYATDRRHTRMIA